MEPQLAARLKDQQEQKGGAKPAPHAPAAPAGDHVRKDGQEQKGECPGPDPEQAELDVGQEPAHISAKADQGEE